MMTLRSGIRARAALRTLCLWFLPTVTVLGACTADLTVPEGAKLDCASKGDCPEGFTCDPTLKRCIPEANRDTESATVSGKAEIEPTIGTVGTVFHIRFEADKELALLPELSIASPGAAPFVLASQESGRYEFTYTATGREREGPATIETRLVTASGAVSGSVSVGQMVFDFTPPEIAGEPVAAPQLSATPTPIALSFATNEVLAESPTVTLAGGTREFQPSGIQTEQNYTFTYTPAGDEPEGPWEAKIVMKDAAGNTAAVPVTGLGAFDFTPPGLEGLPEILTPVAGMGTAAAVRFRVTEPLAGDGLSALGVTLEGEGPSLAMTGSAAGNEYVFSAAVPDGLDGDFRVRLAGMADRAGNVAPPLELGALRIDTIRPEITAGPVRVSGPSVKAGAEVAVEFTASEDLGTVAVLIDNSTPATRSVLAMGRDSEAVPPRYRFTYRASGGEQPVLSTITVQAADAAGNVVPPAAADPVTFDFTGPEIIEESVDPADAKLGSTVLVTVRFAEDIVFAGGEAPVLETTPELAFTRENASARAATFRHVVTGEDPATAFELAVRVTDPAGNPASRPLRAHLRIDPVPPALAGKPVLSRTRAKMGEILTVTFDLDEELAEAPAVTIGGVALTLMAAQGTHYEYERTFDGTEPEGLQPVVARAADAAGNAATLALGAVTLDFTPPALLPSGGPTPAEAKLLETLTYVFDTTEPLDAVPQISFTGPGALVIAEPVKSGTAGTTWTFVHHVEPADTEGDYQVFISLRDLAGNEAPALEAKGFRLNPTVPGLANVIVEPARVSAVPDHENYTVRFSCTENVDFPVGTLSVTAGGQPLTCAPYQAAPPNYTCQGSAAGATKSGSVPIVVRAIDSAGNTGEATSAVEFDLDGPVAASKSVAPRVVKDGALLRILLTVNEALSSLVIKSNRAIDMGKPKQDGLNYTFEHVVTGADTAGDYAFTADMTDTLGNASPDIALGTATVDKTPPGLAAPAVLTPAGPVKDGAVVTVTYKVTKALLRSPPITRIGGNAMTCTGTHPDYSCTYTVKAADGGGTKPIIIELADEAGHAVFASGGDIVFDFKPPTLLATSVNPASAKIGDTIFYSVTASEPLANAPSLVSGAAFAYEAGTEYIFKKTVSAGEPSGAFTVEVQNLIDKAGNGAAPQPGVGFAIDASAPTVSNLALNRAKFSAQSNFRDMSLTFNLSENVSATPAALSVTVGGAAMTCGTYKTASPNYTCTYQVSGGEGAGIKTISVSARDAAGNTGSGSTTAEFDFTAPTLLSGKPNLTKYKAGDTVVYNATFSEAIAAGTDPVVSPSLGGTDQPGFFTLPGAANAGRTAFTYTSAAAMGAGHHGTWQVLFTAKDDVDNAVTNAAGDSFGVDAIAPVLSNIQVTNNGRYSAQPGFNNFAVTFRVNEQIPAANVNVSVAGIPLTCDVTEIQPGVYQHSCARTVLATDPEGLANVPISVRDAAGNLAAAGTAVTFDFTPPGILGGSAGYQLIPGPSNPLLSVTAITVATTARVSFTVTEALASDPVISVAPSGGTWSIVKVSSAGLAYAYDVKLLTGGSPPQGGIQLAASLTDEVGNALGAPVAINVAPPLVVDTLTPLAPDTSPGKILYKRTPWGSQVTSYVPRFALLGNAGAIESGGTIIAYNTIGAETGRKAANADGSFPEFQLATGDATTVKIAAFDGAGNGSGQVEVKDVVWTVTPGGKVPGSVIENPAIVRKADRFEPRLFHDPAHAQEPFSTADAQKIATLDGSSLFTAARRAWVSRGQDRPGELTGYAMVYDNVNGKVVLFGGELQGIQKNDTWEWDVLTGIWQKRAPPNSPTPRSYAAMTFDARRGKAILFGGLALTDNLGDLWEWDSALGTWTQRNQLPTKPSARYQAAMAYDSDTGLIYLYGGTDTFDSMSDVWALDSSTAAWTAKTTAGRPRHGHIFAYLPTLGRFISHGGAWTVSGTQATVWDLTSLYMPGADSWIDIASGQPQARKFGAAAYDPGSQRLRLYGGDADDFNHFADIWEFNPADLTWGQLAGLPGDANARSHHKLVYASATNEWVTYGGNAYDAGFNYLANADLWTFKGGQASLRNPAFIEVPQVFGAESTFAEGAGEAIVFGGRNIDNNQPVVSARRWNDRLQRSPGSGLAFESYTDHAMVYDSDTGHVLSFGGERISPATGVSGNILRYDPGAGLMLTVAVSGTKPPARKQHAMAYDAKRKKTVVFGGIDGGGTQLADMWLWDDTTSTWSQVDLSANPLVARAEHGMLYDPGSEAVFMYGGLSGGFLRDDMWKWDGTSWTEVTITGSKPSYRTDFAFVYDKARAMFLLYGGKNNVQSPLGDIWEFDPRTLAWRECVVDGGVPESRLQTSFTVDPVTDRGFLAGGYPIVTNTQPWQLRGIGAARPAILWQVPWTAAGEPGANISRLDVNIQATGIGSETNPAYALVSGNQLMMWDTATGAWELLAAGGGAPGSPAPLIGNLTDAGTIARRQSGPRKEWAFAIVPTANAGGHPTGGEVAADYAELIVTYRRP